MRQSLSVQKLFLVCIIAVVKLSLGKSDIANSSRSSIVTREESTNVQVGVTIHSISDVNFKQSNFKASVSLLIVIEKSGRPPGTLIVRYDQYQYPFSDLQFASNKMHVKEAYRLITTAPDGTTSTRSSYELEMHCSFDLKQYPFDKHFCAIDVYAVRHPIKQLSLSWYHTEGVRLNSSALPNNIITTLSGNEACNFDEIYAVSEFDAASARFACLRAKLRFQRPFHISFVRYFMPTIVLVMLTWITFYLDRRRLQSRITIAAFSSILTFFCAMLSNDEIPSTAYLTAADVWILLCDFFLLLSLLETIAVHILMKMSQKHLMLANKDEALRAESRYRHEKRAARRGRSVSPRPPTANGRIFEMKHLEQDLIGSTSTSNYETIINDYFHRWSDYYSVLAARTDLTARAILPLAYTVVASLYFTFYLLL